MDAASHTEIGDAEAVSVLFGPQGVLTPAALLELRTTLHENNELQYLLHLIAELPSLWPFIVEVCPDISTAPAQDGLKKLSAFFSGGPLEEIFTPVNNALLCPLTVIIQIVDFWKLTHGISHVPVFGSWMQDVQGFCIGYLTAVAVSCSKNEDRFQTLASKAVRLALCLGAVVDLDSLRILDCALTMAVRWKSTEQWQSLQNIMKQHPQTYVSVITDSRTATITVPERDEIFFRSQLSELNIPAMLLAPRGRWHHADHSRGLQAILTLCQQDQRFRMPDTEVLQSRVLSNMDGKPADNDSICRVALQSILTAQARWDLMFDTLSERAPRHVFIGERIAISRNANGASSAKIPDAFLNHVSGGNAVVEETQEDSPDVPHLSSFPEDAVAVVGMACRYPEADDVEELWDLLSEGKCVTRALPEERFKLSDLRREPKGPFWGGFVRDLAAFDNRFFGIAGREAKSMDPQQRLCLQVAYEAMESAGSYGLRSHEFDQDVGCYIGCANDDYFDNVASHPANAFSLTGTLRSFISGRVSHHLGWTGPSMVLDTACSASAVAIHTACKALKTKECSVAVAGGVCSMSSARMTQHLIAANFLSPTGASRAFDASADGYCRAEGAGLVVLRLLKDAIQCGDHILGIISGTAINQGSNETAIFVPDGRSQDLLYQKVLANSGTKPAEITYVEAHGTGTQVGDPIEFHGIRKIFGGPHRKDDVFVGSIKDNIGHTEASSGTAALIKTILMMQNNIIPKQANFKHLNPKIEPLGKDRVLIPTQSQEWKSEKRTVLINNYGSCGSNAAIILKDPTVASSPFVRNVHMEMSHYPVFMSGKTAESVRSYSDRLRMLLKKRACTTLSSIAYNLALKQNRDFEFRLVLTASDINDLKSQLEQIASGAIGILRTPNCSSPVILCFGGQDGKTAYISKELYNKSFLLQRHLSDCDQICTKRLSLPSLLPKIFSPEPIDDIVNLNCALFAIQYSCARSWLDSGLKVDKLLGHSFGQLTALCVSGSVSLFDALRLVSERARLMGKYCNTDAGVMLAFEGSEDDLYRCLRLAEGGCEHFSADIACYNGPQSFIIAGNVASITAVERASKDVSRTIWTKRLENSHAFHSRLLDDMMPELLQAARGIRITAPKIPIEACSVESWSTITADKIARHTREPVHFAEAVRRIEHEFDGPVTWIEAGSGSPIISMLKRITSPNSQHVLIPTLLRGTDSEMNLVNATCSLWSNGVRVQFWPFHRSQSSSYKWMNLPPYQFAKTKHWLEYIPTPVWEQSSATTTDDCPQELIRMLPSPKDSVEHLFEVNHKHEMYQLGTKGHEIAEQTLCPVSMYTEFVMVAVKLLWHGTAPHVPQISDLVLSSPLMLRPAGRVFLKLVKQDTVAETWVFTLSTGDEPNKRVGYVTHATGHISTLSSAAPPNTISHLQTLNSLLLKRCSDIENSPTSIGFKGPTVYRAMRPLVTYSDYYHGIRSIYTLQNEATAQISLPKTRPAGMGTSFCDPVLVDSFMQIADILANCFTRHENHEVWVYNHIGDMTFTPRFVETARQNLTWIAYSKYERPTAEELQCDIFVFEPDSGQLVLTIMAISFQKSSVRCLTGRLGQTNHLDQTVSTDPPVRVIHDDAEADTDVLDTDHAVAPYPHMQQKPLERSSEIDVNLTSYKMRDMELTTSIAAVARSQVNTESSADIFARVKQILSEITEIPVEQITPSSNFESLGADSLFITEIFSEMNQQFGISLSHSDFANIRNVQELASCIADPRSSSVFSRSPATDMTLTSASTLLLPSNGSRTPTSMETLIYGQRDGTVVSADVYYPTERLSTQKSFAVALLIHGGGHTMSTRRDIRHDQTQALLKSGFIAVSVDYRLCPEVTLKDGPMRDVCDALFWVRNELPKLKLARSDVKVDGQKVVVVGWSSGGQLAMSLGWTARSLGIAPPEAILAFYCPTDYEDEFWWKPNMPYSQTPIAPPDDTYNHLYEGLRDKPVVGYSPTASLRALGGWMSLDDPRARIVLHMNWEGKHLPVLLGGLRRTGDPARKCVTTPPVPSVDQIRSISPLAHIRAGDYTTPTFLIHGTQDDHVPWQQSQRTYEALIQNGVPAGLAVVQGALHLFDMLRSFERNASAVKAVTNGLDFLRNFV